MPGNYKLSTNAKPNLEHDNIGCDIVVYNEEEKDRAEQKYTEATNDVAVVLKEGEIIYVFYHHLGYELSADEARLIFTE